MKGASISFRSSRRRSLRICQDELTMSQKKADRLVVISQIERNKLTVKEGSEFLGISQRKIYRIMKRVKEYGAKVVKQCTKDGGKIIIPTFAVERTQLLA